MSKHLFILCIALCLSVTLPAQDAYTYEELMDRIGNLEKYLEKHSTIDVYAIPEGFQVQHPSDLQAFNAKLDDVLTMSQMANEVVDYFGRYVEVNKEEDVLANFRIESEKKDVGPPCFRKWYPATVRNVSFLLSQHSLDRSERTVPILEYLMRQAANFSVFQDCMSKYDKK